MKVVRSLLSYFTSKNFYKTLVTGQETPSQLTPGSSHPNCGQVILSMKQRWISQLPAGIANCNLEVLFIAYKSCKTVSAIIIHYKSFLFEFPMASGNLALESCVSTSFKPCLKKFFFVCI